MPNLIVAMPLPDEHIRGHAGRIGHLNCFSSYADSLAKLRIVLGPSEEESVGTATALLATTCGIATTNYVAAHTMIPFLAAARHWDIGIQRRHGGWSARGEDAYFCDACISADIAKFGISYWHRTHQLPGMWRCPSHGKVLHFVKGVKAFDRLPQVWAASKTKIYASPLKKCRLIARFNMLCLELASKDKPIIDLQLRRALLVRALELGLRTSPVDTHGRGNRLSDLAIQKYPLDWLREVFALPNRLNDGYKHCIDAAVLSSKISTTQSYCLAISLLFDSFQSAIEYARSNSNPKVRKDLLSGAIVDFVESKGDLDAFARLRSCSAKTASRYLSKNRSKILQSPSLAREHRAIGDFCAGSDLKRAISSSGADEEFVINLLRFIVGRSRYRSHLDYFKSRGK